MSVFPVLFRRGIGAAEIEKVLSGFGSLEWTQAFMENDRLYAIRISASGYADVWKDALAQLPEVELAECVVGGGVRIVHDHVA